MTKKLTLSLTTTLIVVFAVVVLSFATTVHAAGPWFVSPTGNDGNDCLSAATACLTINAAIVKALDGEVVNVAAGVYVENVSLNKSLTLSGAQAGVDARGRLAAESMIVPPSGVGITLLAGSAGATIDGFMIAGGTRGIESQSGPLDGLTVQNNRIVAFTSAGIFLNDAGTDVTFDKNVVDGSSVTGSGGIFHLDTDNFDGMWITNNDIVNGTGRTGLFSDGNHNVGVSAGRSPKLVGNRFESNETGANLGRFSWEFADISDNIFKDNSFPGLQGGIQNSTIENNTFEGNGRGGLELTGFGGAGDSTRGAQFNTITHNTFIGNGFLNAGEGIFLSSGQFPGTIATNVINRNSIDGNADGLFYSGTETIDATCNWWGDASGPSDVGPGTGDTVGSSATIDFSTWLTTSDLDGPCDGPLPAADVTVTLAKYVDGVHATDVNALGLSFPMMSTWSDAGFPDGSGAFSLASPSYEATTADMDLGANYSAEELLDEGNVGASCAEAKPFALVGYSWGETELDAAGMTPTTTIPAFVSLASNQWILVWNETCPGTLIVQKVVINDDGGVATTTDFSFQVNAGGPIFFEGDGENELSVSAGAFTVLEDAAAGYTTTYSNSQNANADCDALSIAPGETVTCVITNDDILPPPAEPPANACDTPGVAPVGFTLVNGTVGSDNVLIAPFTMFVGLGGYDTVNGPADGNYIVCTGVKTDKITLGNGNFTIDAGDGYNNITTGNGNGYIKGGVDTDTITTGDGVQTIHAGDGYNKIITGDGDKTITAGIKADQITTGSGNDAIDAGVGYNNIKSGAGDDTITTGADNDTIDGGDDFDTCSGGGGFDSITNCEA